VEKAVARLKELTAENRSLRGELQAAAGRLEKAEAQARAASERVAVAPRDDGRLEAATRELAGLQSERDEIRRRIGRLVELLEKL
jgi:predicted RNase H-like nuclease (RuvC/YqgF family)